MAVDIVINETIDSVDITVNPNIIEVNVTRTSGGGAGIPTLQQVLDNNHDLVDGNFFAGNDAGYGNTNVDVIGIGLNSAGANEGSNINALGSNAANGNIGNDINALGAFAGLSNEGNNVNALGTFSGQSNIHNNVNLFGSNAFADEDGQTVLSKDGTIMARISTTELTDSRKYTLQDADGTIAFLSDISSGAVDSVNGQTGVVVLDADDIDDTSTTNKFTTASDISKLAGIEANADVTDSTNVNAAGAVMNSDYSSHSILVQQSGSGSPTSLGIANNTLVGRLSGGGSNINDLSVSDVKGLLDFTTPTDVQTIASAKVSNAIVDGVTTVAPSQNAVFDALALKQNDLKTFNRTQGIYFFEEFMGNQGSNLTASFGGLITSISGTGANCVTTATITNRTNQQGVIRAQTGTTNAGYAGFTYSGPNLFRGTGAISLETYVTVETLSTSTDRFHTIFGYLGVFNVNNPPNGLFFAYDEGGAIAFGSGNAPSPNWKCVAINTSVRTFFTSSVAVVAGQWYKLRIDINAAGTEASFYINDALITTITANIPATTTGMSINNLIVKTIGTTTRAIQNDYFMYEEIFTTAR
jgi:hypothetical protein